MPSLIMGGLGINAGVSHSSSSSSEAGSENTSKKNSYDPFQKALQELLGSSLSGMVGNIATGTKSPGVQAMENASADKINATSSSVTDRANRFLAQRGFGKSGAVGSNVLKGELGRQGALAANDADYSKLQLDQNQNYLSDALMAAFNSLGTTGTDNYSKSGHESGTGFGVGIGAGGSFGGGK